MQLAGMVKSPFPLVDPIMIGPMIALANVYCGAMFPELYILICIMVCTCSPQCIYNECYRLYSCPCNSHCKNFPYTSSEVDYKLF